MLESFKTDNPILAPFLLVTFADLKKYIYHYWFAFPALVSKPNWELAEEGLKPAGDEVSPRQHNSLVGSVPIMPGDRRDQVPSLSEWIEWGWLPGQRRIWSAEYRAAQPSSDIL